MNLVIWAAFFVIFIGVLALDLGVLHRDSKSMSVPQALFWTVIWIIVALCFAGLVYGVYEYQWFGWQTGPEMPGEPRQRFNTSAATCSSGRSPSTTFS